MKVAGRSLDVVKFCQTNVADLILKVIVVDCSITGLHAIVISDRDGVPMMKGKEISYSHCKLSYSLGLSKY